MAALSTCNNGIGLTVVLNWPLSDSKDWIDTTDEVKKLTGITRYAYYADFHNHLNHFTLRFTNDYPLNYVFNDSQGHEHPINATEPGDHTVPPFTTLVGPSILSVTIPLKPVKEEVTTEPFDPLCTKLDWPLTDEDKWVATTRDVLARTGISKYSFSWREFDTVKHYFLRIYNKGAAKFVFEDTAGTHLPLFVKEGGEHTAVSTHLNGGPIVCVSLLWGN